MRNRFMRDAMSGVRDVIRHLKDRPQLQDKLRDSLQDMHTADFLYERRIEEAKMIGVRNPAFDGDLIGYPEDDFDHDDDKDDDADQDKNTPK
jgi:hypothetical protein